MTADSRGGTRYLPCVFTERAWPRAFVVLVDGHVEAAGTHGELVQQDGRYAELFELQARGR